MGLKLLNLRYVVKSWCNIDSSNRNFGSHISQTIMNMESIMKSKIIQSEISDGKAFWPEMVFCVIWKSIFWHHGGKSTEIEGGKIRPSGIRDDISEFKDSLNPSEQKVWTKSLWAPWIYCFCADSSIDYVDSFCAGS